MLTVRCNFGWSCFFVVLVLAAECFFFFHQQLVKRARACISSMVSSRFVCVCESLLPGKLPLTWQKGQDASWDAALTRCYGMGEAASVAKGDVGSSARHWLGADVGACGAKGLVFFWKISRSCDYASSRSFHCLLQFRFNLIDFLKLLSLLRRFRRSCRFCMILVLLFLRCHSVSVPSGFGWSYE